MPHSVLSHEDVLYIATHVFLPLQLPDGDDRNTPNEHVLAKAIASAAHAYHAHLGMAEVSVWNSLIGMLDNLHSAIQFECLDRFWIFFQLRSMDVGNLCAYLIRAQNAAIVVRKQETVTTFESFELSPTTEDVMSSQGRLICSYPGPAIEIPTSIFNDESFLSELANFLACMDNDILDAAPTTQKAQSTVRETRDTTHPRYITELLTGILRSMGSPADIIRISKRVGDDVVWNSSELPWRRSSLWLLVRVVLQTSLERSTLGRHSYKVFMLFFMCHLAKEEVCADLSNDLLRTMLAKLSRRLRKLGSSTPDWLSRSVFQTCASLRSILEKRWKKVQDSKSASPIWNPSLLNLAQDIRLSLLNSSDHIRTSLAPQSIQSSNAGFSPEHRPRGALEDFLSTDGAFFEAAYCAEPYVALYDVERTVEEGIDAWVDGVANNDEACVKLEVLAAKYSSKALGTYTKNPELLSIMLLTTIELWIALDKIAIKETPMLAEYSPEVPTRLLEDLLLCRKGNLNRLRYAYQYLSRRHSSSKCGWSIFSSAISTDSFAVRFYRGSLHLQHLKMKIETVAESEVCQKVVELEKANARYADLEQMSARGSHDYYTNQYGSEYHSRWCSKCSYDSERGSMRIEVHEWPLPAQQLHAEAVVFELDCPVSFNMWRSATFHLLGDICTPSLGEHEPYTQLPNYSALSSYLVRHPRSRITLASDTKPVVCTHWSNVSIPTMKESVCVNNGLTLYGFDSNTRAPVSSALGKENIRKYCTYQLQGELCRNLQKYVDTTSHTSNEVMSNQADCHKELSIHEFIAFGHLRSGNLIQWLNILRELRGRSLSFHRHEVHLLLAQAVSQAGPLLNTTWTWHKEIQVPSFSTALLGELESLLRDVEGNWLEAVTMNSISFLARRLLASSPDEVTSQRACALLRAVRGRVFSWTQELSDKLAKAPEDEELRGSLRDAAVTCRSTYDVDLAMIPKVLHTAEDVQVLLSCAILVHHHTPANVSSLPAYSQLLLHRNQRLSLALEGVVCDVIQADFNDQGINLAISWVWPDYRPGSKWAPLPHPNSRWLFCETAMTDKQHSQKVYLDLLSGLLLVDGKPIGRLPSDIQRHSLYGRIFGTQVLDVIPADLCGMDYSTKRKVSGHQVYFSLKGNALVIRAIAKGSSEVIELIPPEKLEEDLPAVLIDGHAHWLNLSTSVMEIRTLDSLWETSLENGNWRINCMPEQYCAYRGHEHLVDMRSNTWNMLSSLLRPLDCPANLILTVSSAGSQCSSLSPQLSVRLPRYGLSFYVDSDGELQSQDMRDMVYDGNQSTGTLFGLANQLVLRPKFSGNSNASELHLRHVLIPEGAISFRVDGHHARIQVNTGKSILDRVTFQTYRIDTDLGCLAGNGSLTSRLYCAYLHALTSGCGTDPLTGRSGTEEALSLLRSAGCWSMMRFSARDAKLLCLVASTCPSRTWYPQHLRRMQQVGWQSLPATSQHPELYLVSKAIKEHYERVQLFHEEPMKPSFKNFPQQDAHLLERSLKQFAYLYPSDPSQQPSQTTLDLPYHARDLVDASSGELRAYTAASIVHHRSANSAANKNIVLNMLTSWANVASEEGTLSLQYDRSWLTPKLPSIWLQAYNLLRRNGERKWFQLLFSLPAMAYASSNLSDLVSMFVAFATDSQFYWEHPPRYGTYDLSKGYDPSTMLGSYVSNSARSFDSSPESSEPSRYGESYADLGKRRYQMYNDRRSADYNRTVQLWSNAWPCEMPPQCSLKSDSYDVSGLMSNVQSLFSDCFHNLKLKEHLTRVQAILNNTYSQGYSTSAVRYSFVSSQNSIPRNLWLLEMNQLFMRPAPPLPKRSTLPRFITSAANKSLAGPGPLYQLISKAKVNSTNPFQRRYLSALGASADCFKTDISLGAQELTKPPTLGTLEAHYTRCKANYDEGLEHLKQHLCPRSLSELALERSGQWPRITAHILFRALASVSPIRLSDEWKRCITRLTLLALDLQRARRLLRLRLDNLDEELRRELENEGCDGWSAEAHPDWLLIQLQGNFLIRPVQAEVANEMISPRSGSNTAMQLNMGEGKSSVIVPIVIVTLADGNQLVRVIVPKALTVQMFDLLADRLGGLVNRRIYFVPFSRSLRVNGEKVTVLHQMMSECMEDRGVLVVQPEHVLSLRLISVEKQLPQETDTQLAGRLLELQKWLHSRSRDILDESDEILHVRYQLVYTIGLQQHMECAPERWTTTEQILALVAKYASSLRDRFPLIVEYEDAIPGAFPHLRILHADAGQQLISWIVQDVINGLLPNFNLGQLHSGLRDAVQDFISCEHIAPENERLVRDYARETSLWGGLLLLRGLLASGILLFAFRERRWRVDYGLALSRTMLAVPYRAKDVPAQRAEFGHPDVAILLTCLSYYYGGLNEEQLKLSFESLLKQDDPTLDYELWVQDRSDIPTWLRTVSGINMKSQEQWKEYLFPLFRRNRATVDFYLSSVVFPKEAKEFPSKLSCSGWDLAEKKEHLLTGFSGTNDGQYLLPLHITQRDPDHQRGTNAKVLSYLLQPENNHYMCMTHENGERRTASEFLKILTTQQPEIRVLLDVGAQMLDLENDQLAKEWLDIHPNASAAIYFNENDQLTVYTRAGRTQPFQSSPFRQQLDQCVAYLDDAHTRGTDIKFPAGFRAAVTLGPKVTKDRLAQGCMRMRKLGHGHSIMFFAPLEVDRRIRSVAGKNTDPLEVVETTDILHWTIRETCEEIQHRAHHWAQQGVDHTSRYSAWGSFCRNELSAETLSSKWLQPEAKRLEELYGPVRTANSTLCTHLEIHQRCVELGIMTLRNVGMDEEQEREVVHEAERERQVERPPKVPPATHLVHSDVITFVKTGIIPINTHAFLPAFTMLAMTSATTNEAHVWSPMVLVTTDFQKTVHSSGILDDYLRPVQWIVSTEKDQNKRLVILSPYEANYLLNDIRSSSQVHLHLYTPRITRSMKPCDDLALYTIPGVPQGWAPPSSLMTQLNMFAGQLYLRDYETYIRLCRFLCIYTRDLQGEEGIEVECDGFISPRNRPMRLWTLADTFQSSPIGSLRKWLTLRRKGMRFALTHMGRLVDGRLLSESDFDEDGHPII